MSGRKTSTVTLSAAVREQLAAERRRRDEERRAQRAAEVERRRQEDLRRRRESLSTEVAHVVEGLDAFAQGAAGKYAAEELQSLKHHLLNLRGRDLAQEQDLAAATKQLKGIRKQLIGVSERAELQQLVAEVEQEQADLLIVKRKAAAMRLQSKKFDPNGLREMDSLLAAVESQLRAQKLSQARHEVGRLRERFAAHRDIVEHQQERWSAMHDEAVAALSEAKQRIELLQADEVVCRWAASELNTLARKIDQAEQHLKAERYGQVTSEVRANLAEADRVEARANELQRDQDERDYVARSIREGLAEGGFWVEEYAAEQMTGTTLRATKADGRAIYVTVPSEQSQPLQWTAEGYPMDEILGTDGRPASACDKAAAQIEAIKSYVAEHRGIETGDLTWHGKDPRRPTKTSKGLTRAEVQATRRIIEL